MSKIIWFTGMSGSGKSYYSDYIKEILKKENLKVNVIDGDIIRDKYKIPVGFSFNEICQNNKNIANICKEEYKNSDITIVSVITPYESIRKEIKKIFKNDLFYIYVYADIESLKKRDTKGLYRKADMGLIDDMIGYSEKSLYEEPENADLKLNTSSNIQPKQNIELLSNFILFKDFMIKLKFISDQEDIYFQKNIIYITFSKSTYLKNQESSNLVYFFDIPHNIDEKEINSYIERNLFFESKDSSMNSIL